MHIAHRSSFAALSKLFSVLVVCTLAVSTLLLRSAHAVPLPDVLSPNSITKGEISRIIELGRSLPESSCDETYCSITFAPLYLSVAGSGGVNFQVSFTSASFPKNLVRMVQGVEQLDHATRPVLLRGSARVRHLGRDGEAVRVPVAGTLFRDSSGHFISLSTKKGGRFATGVPSLISVRVPLSGKNPSRQIASRVSQVSSRAFAHKQCATDALTRVTSPQALSPLREPIKARNGSTLKTIFVATDFDSQYASKLSCSTSQCNNRIVSLVSAGSVFYQESLGYTFVVRLQYGPNGSLGTTTVSENLIESFRRINNSSRSTAAVDLYQLFTGRNLNQNVIGLAYVGVTCSQKSFASMLVQRVSDSIDPLTVAHETGHTLSATHPSTSEGGIMDAAVGSKLPSSFSTRSLAQMKTFLDSQYGKCIGGATSAPTATPAPQATTTPTRTPTPGPGTPTATPGPGETPAATPTVVGTSTPTRGGGGAVGGGKPRTILLTSRLTARGALTLTASVNSPDGCTLTLSAGGSEVAADPGQTLAELNPAPASVSWTAEMPFRVKASSNQGAEIVFFARRTCNGEVVETSKFSGVRPSRVAAKLNQKLQRGFRVVSKKAWITNLASRITQQ